MKRTPAIVHVILVTVAMLSIGSSAATAELVGFWSFDDETADDLSGNDNHGTLSGAVFNDDTHAGSGFSLEITSDTYAQVPHSDSLDVNDAMTISFWMRADNAVQSAAWNGPIAKSAGEPPLGWEFQRFDSESRIDIRVDTTDGENTVIGNLVGAYDDNWVHLAWTLEEGEIFSYLDGEFVATGNYPHGDGFSNPDADLFIGCRLNQWCVFDGLLDEVAIWDSVLSEAEIEDLAAGVSPIDPPDTLPGDYNGDGMIDAVDADLQGMAMQSANPNLELFDENNDAIVDSDDRLIWVRDHAGTWLGDSNFDGEFNSTDFVFVFTAGKYENGDSAGWADGDWDGNAAFTSSDFVAAFSDGGYELGPRAAVNAVPEPASVVLMLSSLLGCALCRGRQRIR